MTADLLTRAWDGDDEAFRELIEPHRRELHLHCYRMLGSYHDAEDALQDSLLTAWRGLKTFEQRASFRTWLYRIATNRCLNTLRAANRRPAKAWDISGVAVPAPSGLGEITWLEPYPDAAFDRATFEPIGPEARYEAREAMSLAFVTALQRLPPRQIAVLVLRDVLGFHASEVAEMLDTSIEAVTSALKRARGGVQRSLASRQQNEAPPAPNSPIEREVVAKFVGAYESGDIDALLAIFTNDVVLSMPPIPNEYRGRDAVANFYASLITHGRAYTFVRSRANGQPALGAYLSDDDGRLRATGIAVLTLAGDRICAITRFEADVIESFELPISHEIDRA